MMMNCPDEIASDRDSKITQSEPLLTQAEQQLHH